MRPVNRVCLLLVVVAVLAVVSRANATIEFQDGFETYTAETQWPGGADRNPGTPPTYGVAWSTTESVVDAVQVLNCAQGTNGGCPGPYSGSNYLQTVRDQDAHDGVAWPKISATGQAAIATGEKLTIDTMICPQHDATYTGQLDFCGWNSAVNTWGGRSFSIGFKADAHLWYYNGTVEVDTGVAYTDNAWQRFRLEADYTAKTYKVGIGDSPTWSGDIGFAEAVSNIQCISLVPSNLGRASFDDFTMYVGAVPEPSSIALLATGLIALLAYAWRRRK